jgi:hypothetical protein
MFSLMFNERPDLFATITKSYEYICFCHLEPVYNRALKTDVVRAKEFNIRDLKDAIYRALQDEHTGFIRKVSKRLNVQFIQELWVTTHRSITSTGDKQFVEGIIDFRSRNDSYEYLVKWKGLSSIHSTWENAQVFFDCKDILQDYLKWINELSIFPEVWKPKNQTVDIDNDCIGNTMGLEPMYLDVQSKFGRFDDGDISVLSGESLSNVDYQYQTEVNGLTHIKNVASDECPMRLEDDDISVSTGFDSGDDLLNQAMSPMDKTATSI